MLTRNDVLDIVLKRLKALLSAPAPARSGPGRPFISEYDVKKSLAHGERELRLPKDAIISPLALDGLALQRIRIVRVS